MTQDELNTFAEVIADETRKYIDERLAAERDAMKEFILTVARGEAARALEEVSASLTGLTP